MHPQRDIIQTAEQVVLNEFSSPSYAYNALKDVNRPVQTPITNTERNIRQRELMTGTLTGIPAGLFGKGLVSGIAGAAGLGAGQVAAAVAGGLAPPIAVYGLLNAASARIPGMVRDREAKATQELQKFGDEELQPRREVSQQLTNKAQEDRLKRQKMIDSLKERDKVTVNPNYEREKAEWEEKQKQNDLRREAEDKARQEEIKARETREAERRARIEAIRTVSPDTLGPVQSNQSVEDRFAAASPEERREMIRQLNIDATKARNAPSPAASLPRRVDQPRYGVDSTPRYGDSAVVRADRFFNR